MSVISFDQYFQPIRKDLYNFALNLTKSAFDADDLVQETSLKVLRNLDRFDKAYDFKSWAMTILRNTFLSNIRNVKRNRGKLESFKYLSDDHICQQELEIKLEDKCAKLLSIINQLPQKSKEPFVMYVNGYSYNEISEILEIPIGTVKSRINYARTILKRKITLKKAS